MCGWTTGEGLDFSGEPVIREESSELDVSADGRLEAGRNQGLAEEEEESSSTEQSTPKSEVLLKTK